MMEHLFTQCSINKIWA